MKYDKNIFSMLSIVLFDVAFFRCDQNGVSSCLLALYLARVKTLMLHKIKPLLAPVIVDNDNNCKG